MGGHFMSYRDQLRPGKRENAFYTESNSHGKRLPTLQPSHGKKVYLYEWDHNQQRIIGRWVSAEDTK